MALCVRAGCGSVCTSGVWLCMYERGVALYVRVGCGSVCTSGMWLGVYEWGVAPYVRVGCGCVCTSGVWLCVYEWGVALYAALLHTQPTCEWCLLHSQSLLPRFFQHIIAGNEASSVYLLNLL